LVAQIARRIMRWPLFYLRFFGLALPWAIVAMGRDQHPFTRQRVEAPMRCGGD